MPTRPSSDRTQPGYYRRSHGLTLERLAAATKADLPVIRAALALDIALRRQPQKRIVALIRKINSLSHL